MLKPLDLLVALCRLIYPERRKLTQVAETLCIGISSAHRGLVSAKAASLVTSRGDAIGRNILEFAVFGARYAFYPVHCGSNVRGIPTAGAAPGLSKHLVTGAPVVWPSTDGRSRGEGLEPLHTSAPAIAAKDPLLYEILAALDLLRIGGARERELAAAVLKSWLDPGRRSDPPREAS